MNAATPFPWPELVAGENISTTFRAIFEHAPIPVARCNPEGVIVEMNPAFQRTLHPDRASGRELRLCELVRPQEQDKAEMLLRDLLDSQCDSFAIEARGAEPGQQILDQQVSGKAISRWTAWRQAGRGNEPNHALLIAEQTADIAPAEEGLLQTQRWEAVGRLAGGVVHDFNNLLTGVMLYCDLLLSSLDARDLRRRYAEEIRSAIVQATGLVKQLLVFARPQATPVRTLCLNEIAVAMRDLLTRLIGENIALDLRLDPELGEVKIDQAQAQQVLLNLVLNARDALPSGGRITVETSNCSFQPVAGTIARTDLPYLPAFPCILLVVGDNGQGMDAATRQRLFEPFFTTKNAGLGTGLGLTTVRSIVTTNRGLIHFESEPSLGTRVMILLPRASQPVSDLLDTANSDLGNPAATPSQEIKKESLL
jgi:two-component system, cell cycle sensor histidine kinase and response regulator CckA